MSADRQLHHNDGTRWDFLKGCLPNGINPTDIDLVFERRGHFLCLEGKREGQSFPIGQRRFYDALHSPPKFIVVCFYGNPPDAVVAFAVWGKSPAPGTADELRALVQRWYAWVEKRAMGS